MSKKKIAIATGCLLAAPLLPGAIGAAADLSADVAKCALYEQVENGFRTTILRQEEPTTLEYLGDMAQCVAKE